MDRALLEKYDMLPRGVSVLAALSGGADSVYLLCSLLDMSAERGLRVCAAHYDHGLRGGESRRDAEFAARLCEELGVPFATERGDAAAEAKRLRAGVEETARALRYEFLERAAEQLSCSRIATAHTADDNAETVLLNLARGAGLRGMCGIPPVRGNVIRPMLLTTRAEVEEYLEKRGIAHVEDSSNGKDDYARNRVRHHAVPALRSVNPEFSKSASKAALLALEDEEYLESQARAFLDACPEPGLIPCAGLIELPRPVAARALRMSAQGKPERVHVDALLELARGEGLGHADIPGERVTREQRFLRFGVEESIPLPDRELPLQGELSLPELGLILRTGTETYKGRIHSSFNTFFFKYDSICGNILCTARRPGDKLRQSGRNCTKRLSDIFTEKHMTRREREAALVLRDGAGVLAVLGVGQAERTVPEEGMTALRIEIDREKRKE